MGLEVERRMDSVGGKEYSFYHTATTIRRSRNKIGALKNNDGVWVHEDDGLRNMVRNHFFNFFYRGYYL